MTPRRVLLGVLITGGILLASPGLVLLGLLAALADTLSTLWSRHGLDRVTYERRIDRPQAVFGDRVEVALTARNAKLLPVPWFRVDDLVSERLTFIDAPLVRSERPGLAVLRTTWTMAPFEAGTRRVHVDADRRGVFELGPVRRTVADVFGRDAATAESPAPARIIVRPRSVVVRAPGAWRASSGSLRSRSLSVAEDPTLFAGVRPFQRGDALRRIHQRASARTGAPLSRRFDPSTARTVVIALDIQTHEGSGWLLHYDEDLLESLIVTAASLARDMLASGAAVGITANGWSRSMARTAWLAPRAGIGQLAAVEDLLARISETPSTDAAVLLGRLPQRLTSACRLVLVTGRDPVPLAPACRRLAGAGHEVRAVLVGPTAAAGARRAAKAGIPASIARLAPDWRTAPVLEIV